MKNNGLPTKKEWDKIVDNAFSSEDIHKFSESYAKRRTALQKGIIMDSNERRRIKETPKKKISIGAVAGLAAAIALVPASVLTINRLGGNKVPSAETGESQTEETTAETTEETTETDTEENTIPDEYATIVQTANYQNYIYINYPTDGDRINETFTTEFTWLPDGLERSEAANIYGKYSNGYGGGMTPCLYTVPQTGIQERLDNSESFEQYETDDRVIMINYRIGYEENAPHDEDFVQDKPSHLNFGREVWVAFKGTKYVQMFYITDDISREDVKQIAENVQLVPCDDETAGEWFDTYALASSSSGGVASDEELFEFPEAVDTSDITKGIGDKINFVFDKIEYGVDEIENVDITLNDAWIQNDFSGLDTDNCGNYCDFSEYLAADGNIWNERKLIRCGDGINTIDTVESTETVRMKVLVIDMTYTNNGDHEINGDSFAGCIYASLLSEEDGKLNNDFVLEMGGTYYENELGMLMMDGNCFSFSSPNHIGIANHIYIPVGGTAEVKLAFIIDENREGNIYFKPSASDASSEKDYIFNLCDVKER